MKNVTIMLVGLLLMLGVGTARAAGGLYVSSSVDVSAKHADPLLDTTASSDTLFPAPDPGAGFNRDEGLAASQAMRVWDYAISPQVTIDLECRPLATEANGADFIRNSVDLKQITQNLMVGFRYKF